jgi:hypothetical protein
MPAMRGIEAPAQQTDGFQGLTWPVPRTCHL